MYHKVIILEIKGGYALAMTEDDYSHKKESGNEGRGCCLCVGRR